MKILLVDDHAIVRGGLRRLFAALPDVCITEAATGREALALMRADPSTLIVLDLNLPGLGGFELLRLLLAEHPAARVVVLTMHAEVFYATRALRAGAAGYLSKNASPEELLGAVRKVADGGRYIEADIAQAIAQALALQAAGTGSLMEQLTERDLEIMRLLGDGRSLSDIAGALGVSYKTVANTCTQIKSKLGVARTADLVRLAIEQGVT